MNMHNLYFFYKFLNEMDGQILEHKPTNISNKTDG